MVRMVREGHLAHANVRRCGKQIIDEMLRKDTYGKAEV